MIKSTTPGSEEKRKYYREYRINRTEEKKEKERVYIKEWRQANKLRIAEYNRKYWEAKASKNNNNLGVINIE